MFTESTKREDFSPKKHLWHNNSHAKTIIKEYGHTDLNHSLSFQRVQCVSDIKGPLLSFSQHERNISLSPYFSLSPRHCLTWKDSKSKTFIFHFLGFSGITESVYSSEALVFIYPSLFSQPSVNVAFLLPTSGFITLRKWLETNLIYPVLRAPCGPLWFWADTLHKSISCY